MLLFGVMHQACGLVQQFGRTSGFRQRRWFQAKEVVPILVAALVWGRQWVGATVLCNSDNEAVVAVL